VALPDSGRLLRKEGLLVADNVAFEDADEFNRMISSHDVYAPALTQVISGLKMSGQSFPEMLFTKHLS